MQRAWLAAILLTGCANGGMSAGVDAADVVDAPADAKGDAPSVGMACEPGQFATSVGDTIGCTTLNEATAVAVRSRCSVYLGQRDSCDGCDMAPTKWTSVSPLSCSVGAGSGNACVSAVLDNPATPVSVAALDLDGNVNDDDKLFTALHCIAAPRPLRPAPCAPGWAVSGKLGDWWMCSPVSEAVISYVGSRCSVYLGWRDSCDGCAEAPTKWGRANDASCMNGSGANNTCTIAELGGQTVNLLGLNTDGDVNGDDKFHLGLSCDATEAEPTTSTTTMCPNGRFVIGINADGSAQCGDPTATFATYMRDHCTLFFGWHDGCDGCTEAPTKWGKVGTASCANGVGADNTCAQMALGGASVPIFGLSPDGDVNGDDTLYVGLRCDE